MFISFLFACSADFQSLDHKEPSFAGYDVSVPFDTRSQPSLEKEKFEFSSQASIDSFCTENTSVVGDVVIFGQDIDNLEGLSCLNNVQDSVHIMFTNITSVYGLKFLTEIRDELVITRNPKLKTLDGLGNIPTLHSTLEVSFNVSLEDTHGLEHIQEIEGDLIFSGNPFLRDMEGLANLEYVGGSVSIIDNDELLSFDGLSSVEEIGEDMLIEHNYSISDLSGWEGLMSIGGELRINGNSKMTSMDGLESLQEVDSIYALYNNHLQDVGTLNSVTELASAQFFFNSSTLCTNDQSGVPYLEKYNPELWSNAVCQ